MLQACVVHCSTLLCSLVGCRSSTYIRLSVNASTVKMRFSNAMLQGVIGISSLSSAWLSMHVALGGLAAAALAAHDTVVFGLLELR